MDDVGNRDGWQAWCDDGIVGFVSNDDTNRYTGVGGNSIMHDDAGNLTVDKDGTSGCECIPTKRCLTPFFGICLFFVMVASGVFAVETDRHGVLNAVGDVTVINEASRNRTRTGLTKNQYKWKRSFRYNYSSRTRDGKVLVTIKARARIEAVISHQIFMPSDGKGSQWYGRLLDHEYDHVAISSDERVMKLLKHLASEFVIKDIPVGSRKQITREFINTSINEELGKYEDAIEEIVGKNSKLLDKISMHGTKAIGDRDLFFSQLYGRENLRRLKFAYLERVGSLLESKEYAKANISSGGAEYLSYDIPDNAVAKKGDETSSGESLEYWVGGQIVARETFYPNGNVAALVMFKNRKQHGPHMGWHENSVKSFESYFNEGVQCHFSRSWHDNGKLKTEMFFESGLRHGMGKQWNRNGELLGEYLFDMGTGKASQWHENGRLKRKAGFRKGKLHGMWKEWDREGRAVPNAAKYYLEGKEVDRGEYLKAKSKN